MSQIHILDGQNDLLLDYVQADDIIDDSHKKSLEDTLEIYDFIALGNRSYTEYLEKRNRLIIPDEDGTLVEFVIFEVARYKDTEGHKVQAFSHASYLELKKAGIIYPDKQGKTRTASQHAGFALNDTGWQVGTVEAKGDKTLSISKHTSPFEFLKHVAKEYNVELRFRVEHDGTKITGRYVDLLERVGEWRGREVEFGRDLDTIRRVEKQDIVTALLGIGPENDSGPRIEVLVEDYDALERWGRVDENGELKHLIEPYEIESERTEMSETEARQYTKTALNKRINTQVTYECTIVDLENVPGLENEKIRFGDTIRIKDTSFIPPLYLEARVFEQDRSIKTTEKKDIKLGDFIEYTEEDVNAIWNQLKEQIKNRVSYYEMVEHTYDRLTIDNKDETIFEEGKSFAEATGIKAEANAKDFAVQQDSALKFDVKDYTDTKSSQAQKAAEAVAKAQAELAELQAKAYADGKISEEEARAIADAEAKLKQAKDHADSVAEQKAQSALDQAKLYAVAKTVYENKMKEIATDLEERAPLEYVDGKIVHAIDNLEVGGRNYQKRISEGYKTGNTSVTVIDNDTIEVMYKETSTSTPYVFLQPIGSNVLNKDVEYTISFYVTVISSNKETPTTFNLRHGLRGGGYSDQSVTLPFNERKRISYTFKPTNIAGNIELILFSNSYEFNPVMRFEKVQLEKGNKASDWTPAPEDIFSQIETKADGSKVYTIEQVDNRINNLVTKTQYITDMNGVVEDVKSHGTRIGQNEKAIGLKADDIRVDQVNNSLTEKIGNVEVKADEAKLSVSEVRAEVDGLEIGGRNYFVIKDAKEDTLLAWATGKESTEKGSLASGFIPISGGQEIVCNAAISQLFYYDKDKNNITPRNISPGYYYKLDSIAEISFIRVTFRNNFLSGRKKEDVRIQLEKGNKSTDWSPAPEDTDAEINQVRGKVESAEGEIKTLAGEVTARATKESVDSLGKRVTSAEGELKVLPGQIGAKVSKDGAFGELNLSPDKALLNFNRVKMTGELEAKHIKSLAGLNVNDQFVVDAAGKVTIGNQRVTIDDKGIQIRRPDGAVAVDDGLMHNAYTVNGNDPHYMKSGRSAGSYRYRAFRTDEGTTWYCIKGELDGRGSPDDADVRDPNSGAMVFQRYEYIHSARYFVFSLWVPGSAGRFSVHFFNTNSDNLNDRLYWKIIEKDFSGEHLCIVDVGKPNFARKEMYVKFGWSNSWGPASEKVEFRVQRVIQTDFV